MALYAKERVSGKGEHVIVLGTVRPVAAGTVQGEVGVPWILHLIPDGMCGVSLVLMAIRANVHVCSLPEKIGVIRCVGGMAGAALAFQDRFVFDL